MYFTQNQNEFNAKSERILREIETNLNKISLLYFCFIFGNNKNEINAIGIKYLPAIP